eukprot:UN29739
MTPCQRLFVAWAPGGNKDIVYGDGVGTPMGGHDVNHLLIQIHYNNVWGDVTTDNSGVEFFYTERQEWTSDIFSLGATYPQIKIPSSSPIVEKTYWSSPDCFFGLFANRCNDEDQFIMDNGYPNCSSLVASLGCDYKFETPGLTATLRELCCVTCGDGIPETPKLFIDAAFSHMHTAGTHVEINHVRNGKEINTMIRKYYDFNFQQFVRYDPPIEVIPGDVFKVTCTWENNTDETIYGGERTEDEMWFMALSYYPRKNVVSRGCQPFTDPLSPDLLNYDDPQTLPANVFFEGWDETRKENYENDLRILQDQEVMLWGGPRIFYDTEKTDWEYIENNLTELAFLLAYKSLSPVHQDYAGYRKYRSKRHGEIEPICRPAYFPSDMTVNILSTSQNNKRYELTMDYTLNNTNT